MFHHRCLFCLIAACAVIRPWESLVVGFIGGMISCVGSHALERLHIDDPVGCVATHFFAGSWGLIVAGLIAEKDSLQNLSRDYGVLKGGAWRLLGVQLLALVSITLWAVFTTVIVLLTIDKLFFKLRLPVRIEMEGADKWEHGILLQEGQMVDCCSETHEEGDLGVQRAWPIDFATLGSFANRTLGWRRTAVGQRKTMENESEENDGQETRNGSQTRKRPKPTSGDTENRPEETADAEMGRHGLALGETNTLTEVE